MSVPIGHKMKKLAGPVFPAGFNRAQPHTFP